MNYFDQEFVQPKKEKKSKNTTKILLIAIILVSIMIVVILCVLVAIKKEPLTVSLDGNNNAKVKELLLIEDENVSIPIKDIAPILGYSAYNGDYINKSESLDKCYVESENEVVNFVANSNKIEIVSPQTSKMYSVEIDEPVKLISGKLYTTPDGLMKAFNLYYNYNKSKNKIVIETLPYIMESYKQRAVELSYKGISELFEDSKASLKDLVITINENGKYGIYNMANKETVLEAKYDKISYTPEANEFVITSNEKMGIKDFEGNDKIKIQYQDISLIDADKKIYLVKKDDRYGVIDGKEKAIIPIACDEIGIDTKKFLKNNLKNNYILLDEIIPIMKDNKWGLFNIQGKQIAKITYDEFGCKVSNNKSKFSVLVIPEYNILVARKDKKYYLLDKNGKELGNGIDFDEVYMETDSEKTTYYVTRNETSANIEKILDKLQVKTSSEE